MNEAMLAAILIYTILAVVLAGTFGAITLFDAYDRAEARASARYTLLSLIWPAWFVGALVVAFVPYRPARFRPAHPAQGEAMTALVSIAAAGIGFLVGLGIGQAVDWWLDRRRDAIHAAQTAATLTQLPRQDH